MAFKREPLGIKTFSLENKLNAKPIFKSNLEYKKSNIFSLEHRFFQRYASCKTYIFWVAFFFNVINIKISSYE